MMTIREYLSKYNLTVNKVASENGIGQPVFNTAADKNIDSVNTKYVFAIAKTLNKTPGQVLDEMAEIKTDISTEKIDLIIADLSREWQLYKLQNTEK